MHRPFSRQSRRHTALAACLAAGLAGGLALPRGLSAQAWFYPSFQTPQIADREYNFAAIAAGGADFLFQWREGVAARTQLSVDAGIADGEGPSNTKVFFGGQWARELVRATEPQPLDVLLTAGAGLAIGNGPGLFRIPVGVSVGHRFPLENGLAITPYVHPRLSIDVCAGCPAEADDTQLNVDFDIGASFELTRQLAVRGSILFSGAADDTGIGIGLTYTPAGVRRR